MSRRNLLLSLAFVTFTLGTAPHPVFAEPSAEMGGMHLGAALLRMIFGENSSHAEAVRPMEHAQVDRADQSPSDLDPIIIPDLHYAGAQGLEPKAAFDLPTGALRANLGFRF